MTKTFAPVASAFQTVLMLFAATAVLPTAVAAPPVPGAVTRRPFVRAAPAPVQYAMKNAFTTKPGFGWQVAVPTFTAVTIVLPAPTVVAGVAVDVTATLA